MVVQLWIAEGLVESSTTQKSWEEVGEEYFDVLVSSSLIQRRYIDGEEENFEMHDLFHDLATMVSFPSCIGLEGHNLNEAHNLSYNRGLYDSFKKFDKLPGVKSTRTFLALPLQEKQPLCSLSNKVVHELLPTMEQLRGLSLSNYKSITEVPNSIGNLLYLRYLNLSHTNIERLPYETCKLYNLLFLHLSGCKKLTELPEDMGKLVNLRHLDVSDTALREMPVQIARLKNLQTLSDFAVSKHNGGMKIVELGKFPHLHGKLSISQLQNVNDPFEASLANMKMKEQIDELALEWDCGSTFSDSQIHSVVLEHLRPSMISFTLGALPVLERLFIEGCKNMKSILIAEDASEKSLSFLRSIKIWDCNELESFPSGGLATPNLVYIALWKCEKLHSLPEEMNSLTGLQEMEIDNLPTLQSFDIDDLPISLQELTVGSVGGIIQNIEPTWEHLTCLSVLRINGNDTVNMLMRPLLPASLVTLCICGFNDTSIDGKWLQHLTSLQNLEIVIAPKLKSLPKVGFPSSLSVLSITSCPLLVASLQRKQGKEWRKIAEISSIIIDNELIT